MLVAARMAPKWVINNERNGRSRPIELAAHVRPNYVQILVVNSVPYVHFNLAVPVPISDRIKKFYLAQVLHVLS